MSDAAGNWETATSDDRHKVVRSAHAAHPSAASATRGAGVLTGAWPNDPTVATVSAVDHSRGIDPGRFRDAVARVQRHGARLVRTGALNAAGAAVAMAAGFNVIDELVLLRADISVFNTATVRGVRHLPRRHHRRAAVVDVAAFGPLWGFDVDAIAHARRATRTSWAGAVADSAAPAGLGGYAVCGVADDVGYLQRLAVHPDCARRGHGHRLVMAAGRWCQRQRCTSVLVNTGASNHRAMALYTGIGFVDTGDRLWVLEFGPARGGM